MQNVTTRPCPGGCREQQPDWARFCWRCHAYLHVMDELVELGYSPAEARAQAAAECAAVKNGQEKPPRTGGTAAAAPSTTPVAARAPKVTTAADRIQPNEEEVRMAIRKAFKFCPEILEVYDLEQGYRPFNCRHCGGRIGGGTRVPEGLADLMIVLESAPNVPVMETGGLFFVECKAPRKGAKRTPKQELFKATMAEAGIPVLLWRSVDDAMAWLNRYRRTGRIA